MKYSVKRERVFTIRDMVILEYMIENMGMRQWYDLETIWCMVNSCGERECTTYEGTFCPRWSVKQVKKSLKKLVYWECLEVRRKWFHKLYRVIHYYPKSVEITWIGL